MILLEHQAGEVRERALALFAGKARRALRLDQDVSILITSSREVQRLNRRHRRKDKPTDVLSFPAASNHLAGDIAISAEIAADNAARLGHSTETELKVLILHGLLHLAGYDHERDNGEMQLREARLRVHLKLPVGLIERTQAVPASRVTRSAAARHPAKDRRR